MSRKDYELIARVLLEYGDEVGASQRNLAERFATALHADNPRFDGYRFISAVLGEVEASQHKS